MKITILTKNGTTMSLLFEDILIIKKKNNKIPDTKKNAIFRLISDTRITNIDRIKKFVKLYILKLFFLV